MQDAGDKRTGDDLAVPTTTAAKAFSTSPHFVALLTLVSCPRLEHMACRVAVLLYRVGAFRRRPDV